MSNRVNANLYRLKDIITNEVDDVGDFINDLIAEYEVRSGNEFEEVELKPEVFTDTYSAKLFIYTTDTKKPKWIQFLEEIAVDEQHVEHLLNKFSSFVLFIYSTDNETYVVSKGYHGHHLLTEYIDKFFGLDVLSKLVSKSDTEIKQIEDRGVFGVELGSQRFFRDNYSLSQEDDFGKIYKAMLASIDEDDFARLGIVKKREDTSRVSVSGSASLAISTSFDYTELISRIERISELLQTEGVHFNHFYKLTSPEVAGIKERLIEELLKEAYRAYANREEMDFYHPELTKYLKASKARFDVMGDSLVLELGSSRKFIDIMDRLVQEDKIDSSNENTFLTSLKNCHGAFIMENEIEEYSEDKSLDQWLSGEVEYNGMKFFKVDNDWYRFRTGFNEHLNGFFNSLNFSNIQPKQSLIDWNIGLVPNEGGYNAQYKDEEGFIVTDRAFLYNVELCDLMRITDDTLYLYHVKRGLGRDLRVLYNQVVNASRILRFELQNQKEEALQKYYTHISNKQYDGKQLEYNSNGSKIGVDQNSFNSLFDKEIVFVFAFSSPSQDAVKDEIIKTKSRIAKLSLIYCFRDMRLVDYDFFIEKISEV